MSTRYTDRDKVQETPPRDSQSIYTANTVQQAKASPPESFPQPPRRPPGTGRNRWFVAAAVIVALALIVSVGVIVIPQLGQHPATQVTPTPTAPVTTVTPSGSDTTPSPTPGVVPGPQNGPPGVSDTAYWDRILGTQGTNGKVERVSFANVLGNPTLQALVTVRHSDANGTLDVYVFDKITNTKPVQLFKMQGLVKGDAKISYYNSVMTAEVDQNSPLNAGKSSAQWTQDLFREFAWNAGEGTLAQEAPLQGTQSVSPFINVTLSRLEGNAHNMWVAIAVADDQVLTIENIEARSQIDNPVKLKGKGSAFEGVIGKAFVLDHLYHDIGHAQVTSIPGVGMGKTTYSTMVLYSTSFKGVQEGIVEVQESNAGISNEPYTAVLVKVLLTPEPGVAMGPLPGPDKLQQPAYWVPIIGVDKSLASVGTVSFANMKGDTSLQALVPVYHTDGSQVVDIYVYDQISSAHPVQLFKLQGLYRGGAIISGYSTILTAQVDPNSSVNKGKSGDQLTTDLYREFKWSDGAGIFVPTAFPGIFPDLTRYQAEMDHNNVKADQDSWKNNAVQVAQRMAAQLLKWSPNAPASVVSGGGAQDVDAVVQVKSPTPGGLSITVTLSRLEGTTSNMWVVIGVTSGNGLLTINTPVKGDRLTSPTTITGTGSAFEGVVGQAFVLDHLYAAIGQAQVTGASNGKTTYSTTIPYTSSFKGGTQEGIVVVYMYSQADGSIATAAMQKVMLSA